MGRKQSTQRQRADQRSESQDAFDVWVGMLTDLVIEPSKDLLRIPRQLARDLWPRQWQRHRRRSRDDNDAS
jgi:hypothetical protein